METLLKLLDDLIRPGNRLFLIAFVVVLVAIGVMLGLMFWANLRGNQFDRAGKFGPLWIHVCGGKDSPKTDKRSYRKLLYVKVNLLGNRKTQAAPFYQRVVDRLDEANRAVAVYDEAVYYTLKLYPEKRMLGPEQDQSSGVVDARLVIPWTDQLKFHNEGAGLVQQLVDIEAGQETDTMLSISHFLNGLQGKNQNFCTYADEDAESLRLVVDFSSVPNAAGVVKLERTQLLVDGRPVSTDDLRYEQCGESVYMAHCRNAKKGSQLKMDFVFGGW